MVSRDTLAADAATDSVSSAPSSAGQAECWDYDEGDLSIYMMEEGSPVFLFGIHERCDDREVPWAEIVAKTRLAATAPELLEALLLHDAYLLALEKPGVAHRSRAFRAFVSAKDAAIAKATGHE